MSEHARGVLITMLGVLAIVPDTLLIRLIDAPHMAVVFWRSALSAVAILAVVVALQRGATLRTLLGLGRAGALYAVLMAVASTLFVLAAQLTTVANTVFIVAASPVFAGLMSRIFLAERLSRRMLWTIAFGVAGVAVIASGSIGSGGGALLGDLAALGAALALAASFTVARGSRHVSMVPAAGLAYLLAAVATLPFAAPAEMDGMDWVWALLLGGVFVPLGTSLMALGPRYIPSAEVALLLLLEAILAPLLVWAVLGEFPGRMTLLGGAILITVLGVSNWVALRAARARPVA
jgi:drug/metabolite transporter (DMT)-like permease